MSRSRQTSGADAALSHTGLIWDVTARPTRWLRAGIFAVVTVALGATAHSLAMGGTPPWWLLIGSGVAIAVLTEPGLRKEQGTRNLVLAVEGIQLLLHVTFMSTMTLTMQHGAWCGRAVPGVKVLSSMTMTPASWSEMLFGHSVWMLPAHLVAGVAVALWLRVGERTMFELAALLYVQAGAAFSHVLRVWRTLWERLARTPELAASASPFWAAVFESDRGIARHEPGFARALGRRGPPVSCWA